MRSFGSYSLQSSISSTMGLRQLDGPQPELLAPSSKTQMVAGMLASCTGYWSLNFGQDHPAGRGGASCFSARQHLSCWTLGQALSDSKDLPES